MGKTGNQMSIDQEITAFYDSWSDAFVPDWDRMFQEAREICSEHPSEECRRVIVDQVMKIEEEYVRRQADVDMQ